MIASRPCFGCLTRKNCDIRRSVTKALHGLPVVGVRIKCDLPFTRDFPAGTRVKVGVWDHADMDEPCGEQRPATVIGPSTKKPGKVLVYLDEAVSYADETKHRFMSAWPKDLTKLDEPQAVLCQLCRIPMADRQCCENDLCKELP